MDSASAIETELLGVVNIKRKKSDTRQQYLSTLITAVQEELGDDEWKALSLDAQNWVNIGATAINSNDEVSDFPDLDEDQDEDEDESDEDEGETSSDDTQEDEDDDNTEESSAESGSSEDEDEDEDMEHAEEATSTKKKSTTKKAAKPAAAAKKASNGKKTVGRKANGGISTARTTMVNALIKDTSISVEDLLAKLASSGDKMTKSTVGAMRHHTRDTLRVLSKAGLLTKKLEF